MNIDETYRLIVEQGTDAAVEYLRSEESEIKIERHYGPGPHPGTGTSQDVHGDRTGEGRGRREGMKLVYDRAKDRVILVPEKVAEREERLEDPPERIERAIERIKSGEADVEALLDFYGLDSLPYDLPPWMVRDLMTALDFPEHRLDAFIDGMLNVSRNVAFSSEISRAIILDELQALYGRRNLDIVRELGLRALDPEFEDDPIEHRGQKASPDHEWGNPDWSEDVRRALSEFEQEAMDQRVENAAFIDHDGNVTLKKSGDKDSVLFTDEEVEDAAGKILIHNHPKGSPLSFDDMYMALRQDMDGVIAVGPAGDRFVLTFGERRDEIDDKTLLEAVNSSNRTIRSHYRSLINSGQLAYEDANFNHQHELFLDLERFLPGLIDYTHIPGDEE